MMAIDRRNMYQWTDIMPVYCMGNDCLIK